MIVTCRSCGKKTPEGKLCQICGAFLAPPVQCPKCGRTMAAGVTKCAICGASIVGPTKPPDLVSCVKCGRKMAPHLPKCQMCGTPLPRSAAAGATAADPLAALDFNQAMQKAVQHARAGQFKEAVPYLDRALVFQPGNADVWAIKGSCLHNIHRYEDALPCYQSAIKLRPDDPATLFNQGNTLRLLGRLEDASVSYERAVRLNPLNAEFQANHALLLRELGRYGEAIPACHAVLRAKPDAPAFLNCLGFSLLQAGKADQALAPLEAAVDADPRPRHMIDYGLCLEALKKQPEADVCFEMASKADPIGAQANHHRARLFERRGDLTQAAEHFYRACAAFLIEQRTMPLSLQAQHEQRAAREGLRRLRSQLGRTANPAVLFGQALRAEGAGRWDDALALYEEVCVFAPENSAAAEGADRMRRARKGEAAPLPALRRMGDAAADLETGDAAKGLRIIDELLASDFPHKGLLRLLKGRGLARLGHLDDALTELDQAPDFAEAWTAKAEILVGRGDLDAAEQAAAKDPDSAASWTVRADILLCRGRLAEACDAYAKALQVDRSHAPAWAAKAEVEEKLGRGADALASTEAFLALNPPASVRRTRAEARLAAMKAAGQAHLDRFKKAVDDAVTGDAAAALPVLEEILARPDAPEKEQLWILKGKALHRLGRLDEALAAYDQGSGWSGKAEIYEAKGDDAKALEAAEAALQRSSTDAAARAVQGHCLRRAGRFPEALACFEEALRKDPAHARSRLGKAQAEEGLGKKPAALRSYLQYLALKPAPEAAEAERRVADLKRELPISASTDPMEIAERGLAYQGCGRHEDALACFLRNTELDPKGSGTWMAVANVYRQLQRYDEALQAIDRALAPDPRDTEILLLKSLILSSAGREAESKACMAKLQAPDMAKEAERLSKAGKHAEALAQLEKVAALDPDYDVAWFGQGQLLQILGRPAEALPKYERALQVNPDSLQALQGLAEVLQDAKRYKESEDILLRCLEKKSPNPKVLMYLAYAREMMGKKEAALEGYARFLWAATDDRNQHVQFARQQHGKLIEALRPRAAEFPPTTAGKWVEKGTELLRRGRLEEAVLAFDGAIKADPYSAIGWLNKGQCLSELGRLDEALKAMDQGLKLAPKVAGAWIMRGTCLHRLNRPEESLKSFEKAVELDPFQSAAWGNKAAALCALRRHPEALPCLERALILDPDNVIALFNKADNEQYLGKKAEAIASFKRFLAIAPEGAEDFVEKARAALRELETGVSPDAPTVIEVAEKPTKVIGGRYEVYKELGRGGFGVVYLAIERARQEICALKTFLDEHAADPESIRMFKSEAQTWINLDAHPHLVRAYFVDEIDGRLYIAMELIAPGPDGVNTLEGYLKTRPPGLVQSLRWAIQFCHGMEYASTKGIRCHRDIKPANIMIDARKNLKISDFGLAAVIPVKPAGSSLRMRGGSVGLSMQGEGGGAGTPTHMPPEQWRSAAACDERSDLYAFGVTLYQMATRGKPPFLPPLPRSPAPEESNRFMAELYQMHLTAAPARLDSPLWPMIEKCLRKDPAQRYRSFRDLRADLEPLLRGQAQGETIAAPVAGPLGADDLVNKAHSLDALGRAQDALRMFDEALQLDPKNAVAHQGKGFVLARTGRLVEAMAAYDAAIALDPEDGAGHAGKANALLQSGRAQEALAVYEKAVQRSPNNPMTWRNKARGLNQVGRLEESIAAFDKALSLDPESAVGWCGKAEALRDAGRFEEAIESLKKGLKLDPTRAPSWTLLGELLGSLQRFDEAVQAYDRAVAVDPANYNAWVNRGGCIAMLGRLDEAMASVDRAIPLSPAPSMAWNNKGDLYVRMKQPDRAMECFDRALAAEPHMVLATQNKALRLRDLGRLDDAVALLEQSLQAHPESSNLWYFAGEFRVMKGRLEPAIAAYDKVVETEKANVRAVAMAVCKKGQCLEKLGRRAEALAAFREAMQVLPGYPDAKAGAARCGG